jgi:hypothetical protein
MAEKMTAQSTQRAIARQLDNKEEKQKLVSRSWAALAVLS